MLADTHTAPPPLSLYTLASIELAIFPFELSTTNLLIPFFLVCCVLVDTKRSIYRRFGGVGTNPRDVELRLWNIWALTVVFFFLIFSYILSL